MWHRLAQQSAVWLVLGLALGVALTEFLPLASPLAPTPLHAVATDRQENFAICTGPVDESLEGIFFLDFLTGTLKGAVLNTSTAKFTALYETNVLNDLGIDVARNPKYLVVTGRADLRRTTGAIQPSLSVVYVAELTSGKVGVYAVPWSRGQSNAVQPVKGNFLKLDVLQFRSAAVRGT